MAKEKGLSTTAKVLIASVLVIGAGLYFLLRKSKKEENTDKGSTDGGSTDKGSTDGGSGSTEKYTKKASIWSPIGTAPDKLNVNEPIVYGAKGEEVVQLQTFINFILKASKKPTIPVDGDFGKTTWNAVRPYQSQAKSLMFWANYTKGFFEGMKDEAEKQQFLKKFEFGGKSYAPWYVQALKSSFMGNDSMVYEPTSSFTPEQLDLDI